MQIHQLSLVCAVLTLAQVLSSPARAQTMAHPDSVSPMKPNAYLQHQDPWRWDIYTQIFLRARTVVVSRGNRSVHLHENLGNNFEELTVAWPLREFEFIYPVVQGGGHYWSPNEEVELGLRINDVRFDPQPTRLQTPDSHAPYIWWRSNFRQDRAHQLQFLQISHVVCADTKFNEKLASQIPWPEVWPEEAERFLAPVIDQIQYPIDLHAQDQLTMMVNRWMNGQDPRSVNEVVLAKFLTGKVIEYVRVGRGRVERARNYRPLFRDQVIDGFSSFPSETWAGYNARSADQILTQPLGSVLDLSTMLTAVLRTAGIPARLLVCYDKTDGLDNVDRIRGLVEFAIYDSETDQILWIPIDPEKLRDNGRRSNTYEQPWLYFGTHDELRNYVPLAHYFHPPVNYKAFGYPGFYGFRSSPDIGSSVSPIISIDVMNSPLRGDELIIKDR